MLAAGYSSSNVKINLKDYLILQRFPSYFWDFLMLDIKSKSLYEGVYERKRGACASTRLPCGDLGRRETGAVTLCRSWHRPVPTFLLTTSTLQTSLVSPPQPRQHLLTLIIISIKYHWSCPRWWVLQKVLETMNYPVSLHSSLSWSTCSSSVMSSWKRCFMSDRMIQFASTIIVSNLWTEHQTLLCLIQFQAF